MNKEGAGDRFDPAAVAADFETPPFSDPAEKARIERLASDIDLTDGLTAASFGAREQRELSEHAGYLLRRAHEGAQESALAAIEALLQQIKALEIGQADRLLPFPLSLFLRRGRRARRLKRKYGAIRLTIDRLAEKLDLARLGLIKEQALLDAMYQKGKTAYHALGARISAGERALARHGEAPRDSSPSPDIHQDSDSFTPAFTRRLAQLRQSRMIGLQQALQIRLTQFNQGMLIRKLDETISVALPLWQEQLALALRIDKARDLQESYRNAARDASDALKAAGSAIKAGETNVSRHREKALDSLIALHQADRQLRALMEESAAIVRDMGKKQGEKP